MPEETTDEVDNYDPQKDMTESIEECFRLVRERKANGGPGWEPKS